MVPHLITLEMNIHQWFRWFAANFNDISSFAAISLEFLSTIDACWLITKAEHHMYKIVLSRNIGVHSVSTNW